jgi:hypothetical protein
MNKEDLRTPHDWSQSIEFVGMTILNPDGWSREPDKFSREFYKIPIPRHEFEQKLLDCTVRWSFGKI